MPTTEATRKALNGQPYQASPSSSATAVGIAVPTAIASKAMKVISISRPTVVRRCARSKTPAALLVVTSSANPLRPAGPSRHASSADPGGDRRSTYALGRRPGAQPLRAVICSVAAGTTVFRSPTIPKSASSKIGASGSLLMATIVFEVCMPARCWIAPEMPTAM